MKAAKKEKKDLDEDEIAHQAKIKAGMAFWISYLEKSLTDNIF